MTEKTRKLSLLIFTIIGLIAFSGCSKNNDVVPESSTNGQISFVMSDKTYSAQFTGQFWYVDHTDGAGAPYSNFSVYLNGTYDFSGLEDHTITFTAEYEDKEFYDRFDKDIIRNPASISIERVKCDAPTTLFIMDCGELPPNSEQVVKELYKNNSSARIQIMIDGRSVGSTLVPLEYHSNGKQ